MLSNLDVGIAFTSYQSGCLYLLGARGGSPHLHECAVPRPMGIARDGTGAFVIAAGHQIIRFANPLDSHESINGKFDTCFVPRNITLTGELDSHDIGICSDGSLVFISTRLNCIAAPDPRHSFRKVWSPPFISELVDEDRCHLNGLAMRDGKPAYVTAVSKSDTIDGWRDRRGNGGVVIDVESGEIVCEGLSMPHSPRWHQGELWVLNSGTGELGVVEGLDKGMGKFAPRVFCPGFARGLSFHGDLAFVGLSRPRYERFEGLELDQRLRAADSEPWCGIQVIDIRRGACVQWFRIDGTVAELYDVEVLPNIGRSMAISPNSQDSASFVTWQGRNAAQASSQDSVLELTEPIDVETPTPAKTTSTKSSSAKAAPQPAVAKS